MKMPSKAKNPAKPGKSHLELSAQAKFPLLQRIAGGVAAPVSTSAAPLPSATKTRPESNLAKKERHVLTVVEVATRWRVTPTHVLNLIEVGSLLAFDIASPSAGRRVWRIPLTEGLDAFMVKNSSKSLRT